MLSSLRLGRNTLDIVVVFVVLANMKRIQDRDQGRRF